MTPILSSSAVIMDMPAYQFVNTLAQCYEANAQLQGGAVPGGALCQPYKPYQRPLIFDNSIGWLHKFKIANLRPYFGYINRSEVQRPLKGIVTESLLGLLQLKLW